jgi:aromatic-amino-acid transaminase
MLADLAEVKAGDVVLLHGCCHNPTGAELDLEQWRVLTELVNRAGAVPMIDLAYQGFGDGLETDAAGLRYMASNVPEMLVAVSCSKNFGLYRERAGAAFALSAAGSRTAVTLGNMAALNRLNFSFPPDHGARLVAMILADPGLRAEWMAELEGMRVHMMRLRRSLAEALRRETNSDRFDFLAEHRGMFSRLGARPEQVAAMREAHGIYMVGDSRINVAGLPGDGIDRVAKAIAASGA